MISIADWFLDTSTIEDYIANFTDPIHKAAEESLTAIDPTQRKSYINEETLSLIVKRKKAREEEDPEEEKRLTAQIKKQANEDQKLFKSAYYQRKVAGREHPQEDILSQVQPTG